MRDLVQIIRSIVREELAGHRAPDLGVVTKVFPGDGGEGNHEVSVRLRETGLEIERVPVCVARPGFSLLPRAGDLVVLAFVGGDLNAPVVIGSLYDSENRPPEAGALEAVYEPPDAGDDGVRRLFMRTPGGGEITLTDGSLTVALGGTEVVVNDGGDVTVTAKAKVVIEASADIEIRASGSMSLEAAAELRLKGATVAIEGQGQAEIKAPAIALAGMTQFRAS
jgi:phage baseplate assembly protein gpV